MNYLKRWETIIGVIVGMVVLVGAGRALDGRYAKTDELRFTQIETRQHIINDRIKDYESRIDRKEDRAGCQTVPECERVMDPDTREDYRKLLRDLEEEKRKYKAIGGT